MAASITFVNKILDSGVQGTINAYTGISVALFSGGSRIAGGNYADQQISTFDLASNGSKVASARVNFAPTGAPQGGFPYDSLRLYSPNSGIEFHSITVSPAQFIANLDTHSILITITGS